MSVPSEPEPSLSITPGNLFPSRSHNCKHKLPFFFFSFLFSLVLWELAGAAPCRTGAAATGCRLEEARGTAFGPCYILFQKAIADISTTYTNRTGHSVLQRFQKT